MSRMMTLENINGGARMDNNKWMDVYLNQLENKPRKGNSIKSNRMQEICGTVAGSLLVEEVSLRASAKYFLNCKAFESFVSRCANSWRF